MAKTIDVKVPDIGDFESVEVIEVLIAVGDQIASEDSLITLESDKATMEIPSPAAGIVMELKITVGDKVSEGDVILVIAADQADAAAPADSEEAPEAEPGLESEPEPEPEAPAIEESEPAATGGLPYASPAVRRLARELEVSLAGLAGTGRKGRITNEDLRTHVKSLARKKLKIDPAKPNPLTV